jgi:hypothetical protein
MPAPPAVMPRLLAWAAIAVALAVAAFGIARGTWAAGGSDSSCYALMADAFAVGRLQPVTPLALEAPWPDALRTFAPAGFMPSPVRAGAASPICAPGFSVLLVPFRWLGVNGIFLATPIAGALTVWLTWVFTRRLAGAAAGLAGAVLVATVPIFLFQVVQPMNDVTSAALWMAVLAAGLTSDPTRPWLLGFLTGLAVFVRPNLAPAAAVAALWLAVMSARAGGMATGLFRRNLLAFVLAALPAAAFLAVLNTALYGGPFLSGYGRAADLFAVANIVPNATRFARTIFETELGIPFIGLVGPLAFRRERRPVAWLAVAVSLSIVGVYLLYRPYPEWWYVRFLLPALVPLTALAVVVIARASVIVQGGRLRAVAGCILVLAVGWHGLAIARERQAFDLHRLERRFWLTGEVARERLPANAVFVSIWESGSLRHHANRVSILWDSLDPASLDSAVAWLAGQGRDPYLVVEQWEEPAFRDRFGSRSPVGALDWPPRFEIDHQVRIYKPADRAAYLRGDAVPTEYIVPR